MTDVNNLITDNINVWTSAIKKRNSQGRGSNSKVELVGVKKLRELILELAVRGKLVAQDSNDEPASLLLDKIAEEKDQLIVDKKIKKPKSLPELSVEDEPFLISERWEWVRLGELGLTQTGGTPKKVNTQDYGNYMPFIKPGDIIDGRIISYTNDGLSEEGAKNLGRIATEDSVLMVCIGSIGKCAKVDQKVSFNQQINSVSPYVKIGSYIDKALQSSYFQKLAWDLSSSTTLPILNKGKWELIPVALPPLAEQHRIVAKVDELMALCEQLEQQTEQSLTAHQTLVEALLNTLTQSVNADDFQESWQRIADHFDVLFTTEANIDQLKQTILQLAVMGKLVPQNPSDEPASVLLEKIAEEKSQLIADKKIKKQKPLPAITDEEKPFEIPVTWEWSRIANLLKGDTQNGISKKANENKDGIPLLRISAATTGENFIINLDAYKLTTDITEAQKATYLLEDFDLLAVRFNGNKEFVGRVAVYLCKSEQSTVYPDKLIRMRFLNQFTNSLLLRYFINSQRIRDVVENYCSTTVGNWGISATNLKTIPIPIPPLAEQHRIVTKVDELMALCDQLKTRLADAQITQLHLADTVVENALN